MPLHPPAPGTFTDEAHKFTFHGLAYGPEFLVGDIQNPLPHRPIVTFLRPSGAEVFAVELIEFR